MACVYEAALRQSALSTPLPSEQDLKRNKESIKLHSAQLILVLAMQLLISRLLLC
jgi:hypothetical protein